jgi:hypothetical protein
MPHSCTQLQSIMERMVRRLPSPTDDELELPDDQYIEVATMPTTLRAAIRLFPEVRILTAEVQEFSVAIEVEGVLQNRNALPNETIDVVFLVDNG